MNAEQLAKVAADHGWAEIDRLYEACLDDGNVFDEQDEEYSRERSYKALIRQKLNSLKDDQGNKIFASVETTDADGNKTRYYKQERLFDLDDLTYVSGYHFKVSKQHYREGLRYARRAEAEYDVRLPLPEFEEELAI